MIPGLISFMKVGDHTRISTRQSTILQQSGVSSQARWQGLFMQPCACGRGCICRLAHRRHSTAPPTTSYSSSSALKPPPVAFCCAPLLPALLSRRHCMIATEAAAASTSTLPACSQHASSSPGPRQTQIPHLPQRSPPLRRRPSAAPAAGTRAAAAAAACAAGGLVARRAPGSAALPRAG